MASKGAHRKVDFRGRATRPSRLLALGLAALACADTSPPDDAPLNTLSAEERVALCDDVRDVVTAVDRPEQCDGGAVRLFVPSNQACRDADLTTCQATAGDVRACYEWAQSDRCSVIIQLSQICLPVRSCDGAVVPSAEYAFREGCPKASVEALEMFDGVYAVTSFTEFSSGDARPGLSPADLSEPDEGAPAESCEAESPMVIEPSGRWIVLVTTQVSGTPLVVLRNCSDVADCQARAQMIRAAGDDASVVDADELTAFYACEPEEPGQQVTRLDGLATDAARSCQRRQKPSVMISGSPSQLVVDVSGPSSPALESSGCGYVVSPSPREPAPCTRHERYSATLAASL
jgi:hypothetical protein